MSTRASRERTAVIDQALEALGFPALLGASGVIAAGSCRSAATREISKSIVPLGQSAAQPVAAERNPNPSPGTGLGGHSLSVNPSVFYRQAAGETKEFTMRSVEFRGSGGAAPSRPKSEGILGQLPVFCVRVAAQELPALDEKLAPFPSWRLSKRALNPGVP